MTNHPARTYRLGVLHGDGIGPEIVPSSVAIVDAAIAAAGVDPIEWHELPLGASAIEEPRAIDEPQILERRATIDDDRLHCLDPSVQVRAPARYPGAARLA